MEDLAIAPHDAAKAPSVLVAPPPTGDPEAGEVRVQRSPEEAEQLVLELIATHADSLLRTARRYSLCADDAQDAYQRGLEILMRHAARLDGERAGGWLHTVVKHEALAINRARCRIVGGEEVDLDAIETRTSPSPEDRVLAFEQVARSAEALQRLKPQEVRALWLKAMGNSYQEICEATGWSYTKVNRCLAEGRKSFLARYAGIEEGEECRRWAPVISAMVDGEATAEQLLALRPHLRNCPACRAAVRELRGSNAPLAALFPVGVLALGDRDGGPLDAAGDLLSRLWQSLWGDLSDRAATAAFRAQSLAQAVLPGKSMAIFASVAALAGGGVAIDEVEKGAAPPRAALHVPSVSTAADRITRGATLPSAPAAATVAREPARATRTRTRARRAPKRRVRQAHRRHAIARPHRRHVTSAAARQRPARATTSATVPAAPATSTTTLAPPVMPRRAPASTPAPAAPARPQGATGGEFGFETP